jgi:hypothetical protein
LLNPQAGPFGRILDKTLAVKNHLGLPMADSSWDYWTVELAAVVLTPPGVVTVIGPLMAPVGTVAHT